MSPPLELLMWSGIVLTVIGLVSAVTLVLTDRKSFAHRWYTKHVNALEAECRFLFLETTGKKIARTQLFVGLGIILLPFSFFDMEDPVTWALIGMALLLCAWLPRVRLKGEHDKRVRKIEGQLDSWLLLLANALKATPSLGEATAETAKIIRAPMGQELDLLLKEVKLGTPFEQALKSMADRIGSRSVAGALGTILVGRQTGGDLTRILQESAATLREMSRLEGVVRAKTAEGKAQAYVLGAIPFILIGAIQLIDPNWLRPLGETTMGFLVVAGAGTLWVAAIFAARKILAVDV